MDVGCGLARGGPPPGAQAVRWLHGDATMLPPLQADLATMTDVAGVGAVESWTKVTDVALPLVSRHTFLFAADGAVLTSDSTLRSRERAEVEACSPTALTAHRAAGSAHAPTAWWDLGTHHDRCCTTPRDAIDGRHVRSERSYCRRGCWAHSSASYHRSSSLD